MQQHKKEKHFTSSSCAKLAVLISFLVLLLLKKKKEERESQQVQAVGARRNETTQFARNVQTNRLANTDGTSEISDPFHFSCIIHYFLRLDFCFPFFILKSVIVLVMRTSSTGRRSHGPSTTHFFWPFYFHIY